MPHASRSLAVLFALCGGLFLPTGTAATAFAGPGNLETAASLAEAVTGGRNLERARQWGAAIRHYDDALERFAPDQIERDAALAPDNIRALHYGLRRSKIHFGIHRRYADASYTDDLLARSPEATLRLYDDVLAQVRRNYVEPIGAASLVAHGTESLYLALSDRKFLDHHLPRLGQENGRIEAAAVEENVERFREVLRNQFWNAPVREGDERRTVARVARLGRELCGLEESAVVLEYLCGATNALDDYSTFLTPEGLSSLYGNIEGNFVGIGIEIEATAGRGQFLRRILPGSPAEAGGAKAGEYISAISGVDCREMSADEAAKLLRGPEYSRLTLELTSGDGSAVRTGRFVRRTVEIKSVEIVEMVDEAAGVGYIRMGGFQETTAREMADALNTLRRQGMTKLIWDVRGNPGGLLDAAVDVLDLFIKDGVLVGTRGPAGGQTQTYTARARNTLTADDLELILLVDDGSASASEIVAGCLRDHGRGRIVGRTTYGKWSVQSIIDLADAPALAGAGFAPAGRGGSGLKLTTARFYSPAGKNYMKIGMIPDVTVPEFADDLSEDFIEEAVQQSDPTDDLFAAANPAAADPAFDGSGGFGNGGRLERTSNYRPTPADRRSANRGSNVDRAANDRGPRVPQTSLPLHTQPDIRTALKLFR
ncbi:MAG: S41 family peptidase [Planctomycetota bacterium]